MSTISPSERLRRQINVVLPQYEATSAAIVTHPRLREFYGELLMTMHACVRSTVPRISTALERCRELAKNDPVAAALIPHFEHHMQEEAGHDEWLLQDLELLGFSRSQVLRRMPSPAVATFVGAEYYWIVHHHPIAELGHSAVMEGHPPTMEVVEYMVETTGLPRDAFRTIERHAHLDVHHRDELNQVLESLPLREEHHTILGVSALHTIRAATAVMREVLEQAPTVVAA